MKKVKVTTDGKTRTIKYDEDDFATWCWEQHGKEEPTDALLPQYLRKLQEVATWYRPN